MLSYALYILLAFFLPSLILAAPYSAASYTLEDSTPSHVQQRYKTSSYTLYQTTFGGEASTSARECTLHVSSTGQPGTGVPGFPQAPFANRTSSCPSASTIYSTVTSTSTATLTQMRITVTETSTAQVTVTSTVTGAMGNPGGNGQPAGTVTVISTSTLTQMRLTVTEKQTVTSVLTGAMGNPGQPGQPGGTVSFGSVVTGAAGSMGAMGQARGTVTITVQGGAESCTVSGSAQPNVLSTSLAAISSSYRAPYSTSAPPYPFPPGGGNGTMPAVSTSEASQSNVPTLTTLAGSSGTISLGTTPFSGAQVPPIPSFTLPRNTSTTSVASFVGTTPQAGSSIFTSAPYPVSGNATSYGPISGGAVTSTSSELDISTDIPVPGFPAQPHVPDFSSSTSMMASTSSVGPTSTQPVISVPGFPEQSMFTSSSYGTYINSSASSYTSHQQVSTSTTMVQTVGVPTQVPNFPQPTGPRFMNTSTSYTSSLGSHNTISQFPSGNVSATAISSNTALYPETFTGATSSAPVATTSETALYPETFTGPTGTTFPMTTSSQTFSNTGILSFGSPPSPVGVPTETSSLVSNNVASTSATRFYVNPGVVSFGLPPGPNGGMVGTTTQATSNEVITTGVGIQVPPISGLPQLSTTRNPTETGPMIPSSTTSVSKCSSSSSKSTSTFTSATPQTKTRQDTSSQIDGHQTSTPLPNSVTLQSTSLQGYGHPTTSTLPYGHQTTSSSTFGLSTCPCKTQTVSFTDIAAASPLPTPYNSLAYNGFIPLGLSSADQHLSASADTSPSISIPQNEGHSSVVASFDLQSLFLLPCSKEKCEVTITGTKPSGGAAKPPIVKKTVTVPGHGNYPSKPAPTTTEMSSSQDTTHLNIPRLPGWLHPSSKPSTSEPKHSPIAKLKDVDATVTAIHESTQGDEDTSKEGVQVDFTGSKDEADKWNGLKDIKFEITKGKEVRGASLALGSVGYGVRSC